MKARARRVAVPWAAVTWACLFAVPACGSTQFDGVVFRDGPVAFRVPAAPEGWRKVEISSANLSFRDDARGATMWVNGRCNARDGDAPLAVLVNHLIMGTTERSFVEEPGPIAFDGREALQRVIRAKLDGYMMEFDIFVMKKDGCVYDLAYVAPPDRFGDGRATFEQYVRGFHTLGNGGL